MINGQEVGRGSLAHQKSIMGYGEDTGSIIAQIEHDRMIERSLSKQSISGIPDERPMGASITAKSIDEDVEEEHSPII